MQQVGSLKNETRRCDHLSDIHPSLFVCSVDHTCPSQLDVTDRSSLLCQGFVPIEYPLSGVLQYTLSQSSGWLQRHPLNSLVVATRGRVEFATSERTPSPCTPHPTLAVTLLWCLPPFYRHCVPHPVLYPYLPRGHKSKSLPLDRGDYWSNTACWMGAMS